MILWSSKVTCSHTASQHLPLFCRFLADHLTRSTWEAALPPFLYGCNQLSQFLLWSDRWDQPFSTFLNCMYLHWNRGPSEIKINFCHWFCNGHDLASQDWQQNISGGLDTDSNFHMKLRRPATVSTQWLIFPFYSGFLPRGKDEELFSHAAFD